MRKPSLFCTCLAAAALWLVAAIPMAQPPATNNNQQTNSEQFAISPAQAGKIASGKFGGKLIDVRALRSPQGYLYRVRLLQNSGRVITVHVNADNGNIL